ncbi:thioredoxin-like protein [Calocera cornea HHB12733]|uniref:Thioredoxin-like protein n=1 Tax=Calocera cornea HHB12733 TaxID=1353952 RepID=A0A165DBU6_9BASI|nr:thioredoxin-like protein [Calocera cornea HHB12733]
MSLVKPINTPSELSTLLTASASRLVVIDFMATWCGPCHQIAPLFESLAKQYKHAAFARVDVDKSRDVAGIYSVTAMPTFVFVKGGQEVGRIRGASPGQLQQLVAQLVGPAPAATAEGSTSKGKEPELSDTVSLLEFLDPSQCNCLNEAEEHGMKGIVSNKGKNQGSAWLESDADEQLLLNVYFNQAVRVRALVIQTKEVKQGPKKIKLFLNKPALGFEDVEDAEEPEAAQIIELTEENLEGKPIILRTVRFTRVTSLHIFVSSNQSDEETTRIDAVDILGMPIETTDMSNFKKSEDD